MKNFTLGFDVAPAAHAALVLAVVLSVVVAVVFVLA